MKHAILGAGAIGGLMGTALASLGEEVLMLVRPEKAGEYPRKVVMDGLAGRFSGSVRVAPALDEPANVLWIATKTYQLEDALRIVHAEPSMVVPLLNGIDHVTVLRARFGKDRVVPGTISVEAERAADGHFVQRSPIRLNIAASGEAMLAGVLNGLRELGFACQFVANEKTLLWGKLCFLGPFALVTSASGKNLGEINVDEKWKAKLGGCVAEACAVAQADGAEVDAARVTQVFAMAPATMRSSMAKDLVAGRRLELDGIAGPILRGGVRYGVPVPVTTELVKNIEQL